MINHSASPHTDRLDYDREIVMIYFLGFSPDSIQIDRPLQVELLHANTLYTVFFFQFLIFHPFISIS